MRLLKSILFAALAIAPACAQSAAPDTPDPELPTLMKYLSDHHRHNLEKEWWNFYGQFTYISAWKPSFSAPYTNLNGSTNSLLPDAERSFTGTATFYIGVKPWHNGEVYVVPEIVSEQPLSQLKGLGGAIQDFELQKGGDTTPTLYRSRAYLTQTFNFGGDDVKADSGPMQLATKYKSRRLVFHAGNYSILDFLDKPAFDLDPRQGLYNLAFLTYSAYDFASDARGYSWGLVSELYWDNWAIRHGRMTPPKQPNQLDIDWRIFKYYGDQIEIEHDHKLAGQDGKIRLLMYRNHENIGSFSDAINAFNADPTKNAANCTAFNYGSTNSTAPDLCWVRKPAAKTGIGAFTEQYITKDIDIFARGMVSDGKHEVYAYTSTDRSFAIGSLAKGSLWNRPLDVTGIAYNAGWISSSHAQFLGMGGIDGFIGDGAIHAGPEGVIDLFYSTNFFHTFWASGDYQHITNPAFNRDRGPVNVYSLKIHGEF